MRQKLENFASSEIEAIAQRRGRNAEWANGGPRERLRDGGESA